MLPVGAHLRLTLITTVTVTVRVWAPSVMIIRLERGRGGVMEVAKWRMYVVQHMVVYAENESQQECVFVV